MSVRRIHVHGRPAWQARVSLCGFRRSRLAPTRSQARQYEADLLQALRVQAQRSKDGLEGPATLRMAFAAYEQDLEARGKGSDTIARAEQTSRAVAKVMPEYLDRPPGEFSDKQIFLFRHARICAGIKPATTNRDFTTLRAILRKVRPEYRFPAGAFFREDNTRVRWLDHDEEMGVLKTCDPRFEKSPAWRR